MRVIIAEDNPIEMDYLKKLLTHDTDITIIGEALDGKKALELINSLKPDVVFLDISMPGISGVEIARIIDPQIKIVFITAHQEFAIEAFEVGSTDYLVKPIERKRLLKTLNRIRKLWFNKSKDMLPIKVNNETVLIESDEIIFIEKQQGKKKVVIYTYDNYYIVNITLNNLESRLGQSGIVRTHKSFLVNINKIVRILPWGDKSYLAKIHGTQKEVIISRKYAPKVKSFIKSI